MARTELDVANEALHALQESPIADLSETGKAAEALKFTLPIARQTVIQMYDWTCAKCRSPLIKIEEESPGVPVVNFSGRAFVYQEPAMSIQLVDVLSPGDFAGTSFIKEGSRIYSDTDGAIGVFTIDLVDPAEWDALLATSVSYMLASRVAYTITGQPGRESQLMQSLGAYIAEAKKQSYSEARQRKSPAEQWAPGLFESEPRR